LLIISQFFGIIIRMFYDEHNPPHLHAEYQGRKALFDFSGNVMLGSLSSKSATILVREWIDQNIVELGVVIAGKPVKSIKPLIEEEYVGYE